MLTDELSLLVFLSVVQFLIFHPKYFIIYHWVCRD